MHDRETGSVNGLPQNGVLVSGAGANGFATVKQTRPQWRWPKLLLRQRSPGGSGNAGWQKKDYAINGGTFPPGTQKVAAALSANISRATTAWVARQSCQDGRH